MILIGLLLVGLALVGCASSALDPQESKDSRTLDALLFMLCLVGIVSAKRRKAADDLE